MPITINGATGISGVDGTAVSPAVEGGDTNTGMFFPAADTVAITTNGTERMRVDSSGNVGIGTASPSQKLQVTSSMLVGDGSGAAVYTYYNGTGTYVGREINGGIQIGTNAIERLRIAIDGSLSSVIPSGSTLYPSFTARAWVNFNGTGTVAIRGSGNVTSITDNNVGDYTVNFTTAMPDTNYSVFGTARRGSTDTNSMFAYPLAGTISTTAVQVKSQFTNNPVGVDCDIVTVVILR